MKSSDYDANTPIWDEAKGLGDRKYVIKDSGQRKEFAGGMVRDIQEGKVDWWRVLVGPMLKRYAEHLTKGNTKYPDVKPGVPNWTLAAGDEEYNRFKQSAFRHFIQWFNDEMDEDHASAVWFNINGAEFLKDKKNGVKGQAVADIR